MAHLPPIDTRNYKYVLLVHQVRRPVVYIFDTLNDRRALFVEKNMWPICEQYRDPEELCIVPWGDDFYRLEVKRFSVTPYIELRSCLHHSVIQSQAT